MSGWRNETPRIPRFPHVPPAYGGRDVGKGGQMGLRSNITRAKARA